MGKAQLEELNKCGRYFSVPSGVSMLPMMRSREGIFEIHRLEGPARRYDVVLYIRGEEQGVIHRVLRAREKDYVIAGDNCWQKEYIPKERVVGIAVRFYRGGRWYDVDNRMYLIYVHLWTDLFFIRRPLFYVRDKIKRSVRKIKNRR